MAWLNGRRRWIHYLSRSFPGGQLIIRFVSSQTVLVSFRLSLTFALLQQLWSHRCILATKWSGLDCFRHPIRPFNVRKFLQGLSQKRLLHILLWSLTVFTSYVSLGGFLAIGVKVFSPGSLTTIRTCGSSFGTRWKVVFRRSSFGRRLIGHWRAWRVWTLPLPKVMTQPMRKRKHVWNSIRYPLCYTGRLSRPS